MGQDEVVEIPAGVTTQQLLAELCRRADAKDGDKDALGTDYVFAAAFIPRQATESRRGICIASGPVAESSLAVSVISARHTDRMLSLFRMAGQNAG